jgi:hypothetical protein
MATSKIKTVRNNLKKVLDYIQNEEKTDGGSLVTTINCDEEFAFEQFQYTKEINGKTNGKLGFHMIQSFKPGEVDFNTAHDIGVKLVKRILGNNFEVVIATHTDRSHIHNHIVWNSISKTTGNRYYDNKISYNKIREVSDQLCIENGLSIIEPKNKGLCYKEWMEFRQGNSWKAKMKDTINEIIKESKNYNDFKIKMKKAGYTTNEGKHIAFRHQDYKRFVRGKTLGVDFTKEAIIARIEMARMGLNIINFRIGSKKYDIKQYTNKRFHMKNKSILVVNIQLGIKIIQQLMKNYDEGKLPKAKHFKSYNSAVVDSLSEQLKLVGEYKIHGIESLNNEIEKNDNELMKAKEVLIQKDKILKVLGEAIQNIEIYEKNKKYSKGKKSKKEYNQELKAFETAKNKLIDMKIDEKHFEKAKEKYKSEIEKTNGVKIIYRKLKDKKSKLNELGNTLKKINSREFPFADRSKNIQKQKDRDIQR